MCALPICVFAHILTNTTKDDVQQFVSDETVPYVRLLGMTKTGQSYLNARKKDMDVPLISTLAGTESRLLSIEEKASHAYYSIISRKKREAIYHQELVPPIII